MVAARVVWAGLPVCALSERKVRASQGAMPDNVRAGRLDGKRNRKYTAGKRRG